MSFYTDEVFKNIDGQKSPLIKGDYENCQFLNCNFNACDLSGINFMECFFKDCDLSRAPLYETGLKTVQFEDCKLLGLHFDDCSEFLFSIEVLNCKLDHSIFFQRKLDKAKFKNSTFIDCDFSSANLSAAVFDNCDLNKAKFDNCDLRKANFSSAYNYHLDLDSNKMKGAIFSASGLSGLLDKYQIKIV